MFVYKNKKIIGLLFIFLIIITFFVKFNWLNDYFGVQTFAFEDIKKLKLGRHLGNSSGNRNSKISGGLQVKIVILVWKYGVLLENRHIHRFQPTERFSPWEDCPTQHPCELIYSDNLSTPADAVLFHLHKMTKLDAIEISNFSRRHRDPKQIWVFLTDESPLHTIIYPEYDNLFNFSMTYRSDSDVWVPYGRTVRKTNASLLLEIDSNFLLKIREKSKLVVVMGSNCSGEEISGSRRWSLVEALLKIFNEKEKNGDENSDKIGKTSFLEKNNENYDGEVMRNIYDEIYKQISGNDEKTFNEQFNGTINRKINEKRINEKIDKNFEFNLEIIGRCLNGNETACPGHFTRDCPLLDNYKFYLAFENSNCREYITEKVFWNAYTKFSVPVIMGAPRDDCEKLLPPDSFIHIEDFETAGELADYLIFLGENEEEYLKFHEWRRDYEIINEHGYFGSRSRHYCRLCEVLNRQRGEKIYGDLEEFWNESDCDF